MLAIQSIENNRSRILNRCLNGFDSLDHLLFDGSLLLFHQRSDVNRTCKELVAHRFEQRIGPAEQNTEVDGLGAEDDVEHFDGILVAQTLLFNDVAVVDREDFLHAQIGRVVGDDSGFIDVGAGDGNCVVVALVDEGGVVGFLVFVVLRIRNNTEGVFHVTKQLRTLDFRGQEHRTTGFKDIHVAACFRVKVGVGRVQRVAGVVVQQIA